MRAEYDLSKMKFRRNPYAARLKKSRIIRLGTDIIQHNQPTNRKELT